MSTLDERLADEEYRHWIKAALCLQYTKDGLVPFADRKSEELHNAVLKQLRKNNNPSVNGICASHKIDYKSQTISCCGNCQTYLDEASRYYTGSGAGSGIGLRALNLKNSEVTNLQKQHWQMAKLFMNPGQDVSNSDPSQTDISGILNFIDHCGLAKKDIQNSNYVNQVRDIRNRILHNADLKITKHDFTTNIIPTFINLLQDSLYLLNDQAAQEAVLKIKKVEWSSFHISKDDEIQVLKDMLGIYYKYIQGLDTGMRDLTKRMNDSEKTTRQEVQRSIDCLKNWIKDDNELRNLMKDQLEAPLKDVKDEMQLLHQEIEKVKDCLRGFKRRLDIEEKRTTEGFKSSLKISNLRDGYKETRLQVHILPDCYTLAGSNVFTPAVMLKEKKSCLNSYGALEQKKLDPETSSKAEKQDQKTLKSCRIMGGWADICQYPYLYRLLRPDENPSINGIKAKHPGARVSVEVHVLTGSRDIGGSPYISTSATLAAVREFASHTHTRPKLIVKINTARLQAAGTARFLDLTVHENRVSFLESDTAYNFANKLAEVLVPDQIPSHCITEVFPIA